MTKSPQIQENISLSGYNTFHVEANARYFCEINSIEDFISFSETEIYQNSQKLILGGGSNILFTRDFDGLVLKNNLKGISISSKNENQTIVQAGSGEAWHDLVLYTLSQNFGGLENLSYIPGTVGAAPVQNIGAYGSEFKDACHSVQAIDLSDGTSREFSKSDCKFGYRDSIFKTEFKNHYFITSVKLEFDSRYRPKPNYRDIRSEIEKRKLRNPDIQTISRLVTSIRQSKLPDPAELGNSGSFFKNPTVEGDVFKMLSTIPPGINGYQNPDGSYKIPAAWLIEHCGWKGNRTGDVGTYNKQALILVNHGKASGKEILEFAEKIRSSVLAKYGIELEFEVNIL